MGERIKALIVEDTKPIQAIYNFGLEDSIFEKRIVATGDEALEIYDEWRPDLIILDIVLPGMSGYTFLKTIREEKEDRTTTVIMASSISDKNAVVDCLKQGIQGYLVKPILPKEVGSKVLEYYRKANPGK